MGWLVVYSEEMMFLLEPSVQYSLVVIMSHRSPPHVGHEARLEMDCWGWQRT